MLRCTTMLHVVQLEHGFHSILRVLRAVLCCALSYSWSGWHSRRETCSLLVCYVDSRNEVLSSVIPCYGVLGLVPRYCRTRGCAALCHVVACSCLMLCCNFIWHTLVCCMACCLFAALMSVMLVSSGALSLVCRERTEPTNFVSAATHVNLNPFQAVVCIPKGISCTALQPITQPPCFCRCVRRSDLAAWNPRTDFQSTHLIIVVLRLAPKRLFLPLSSGFVARCG